MNTGYTDAGYFIRQFKQLHRTSPNLWRKSHKNDENYLERSLEEAGASHFLIK